MNEIDKVIAEILQKNIKPLKDVIKFDILHQLVEIAIKKYEDQRLNHDINVNLIVEEIIKELND